MQLNYYLNKKNVFVDTKENCQQQQQQRICLKDTVDRQCQSQIVLAAFSPPSFDTQQHTKRLFAHCSSIRVLHLPKTKKNEKNIQKKLRPVIDFGPVCSETIEIGIGDGKRERIALRAVHLF